MINKAILEGRIVREIELRKTASGKSYTSFTLAVNRTYKQEGQPDADFITCVAWGRNADVLENYTEKGTLISVDGHIQTRSYESNGKKVYVTEVVCESVHFIEAKKQKPVQPTQPQYQQPQYHQQTFAHDPNGNYGETIDIDSDLPF